MSAVLVLLIGLGASLALPTEDPYAVPPGLLIGAGTSAIQTEGAWNTSGKAESAADHVLHTGKLASLGFTDPHQHDVAADSYHRYKEDIAKASELKLQVYRFSFSWSRVLPTTDPEKPNPEGVQFYHDFIDEILKYNITPLATLYHFDHPWTLENEFHGWQSEKIVEKFVTYASFIFKEYGSKVKRWITINEPNMYCTYFPALNLLAGIYTEADMDQWACKRNTILAHARAYRVFKENNYEGEVGFSALMMPGTPKTTSPEDVYAADVFNLMLVGSIYHPVVYGDYPDIVKNIKGDSLVPFSPEEKALINGTSDFLSFNIYFGMNVYYLNVSTSPMPHIPILGDLLDDIPFVAFEVAGVDPTNPLSMFSLIAPDALRSAVLWTWDLYKLPLVVSENGMGDYTGMGMKDERRAAYHSAFLRTLVKTMKDFGVPVTAYCAWSMIDSFEWSAGFGRPFGLVYIDYASGSLDRKLKDSSYFWIDLAKSGVVPLVEAENTTTVGPVTITTMGPVTTAAPTQPSTPKPDSSAAQSVSSLLLVTVLAVISRVVVGQHLTM